MSATFYYALTTLAVLATAGWLLLSRENYFLPEATPQISTPSASLNIPAEFQSGNSRYSHGSCEQNSDCATSGCSGEVCMNTSLLKEEKGSITTCEYSESFPNAQGYTCGCIPVKNVCGWR